MKYFYSPPPFFILLFSILFTVPCYSETLERSTEYSSPYGSYKELTALNSMTVGIAPTAPATPANAATGVVTVNGSLQISNGPTIIEEKLGVDGDTLKVLPYNYWGGLHWVNIGQPSPETATIDKLSDLNVYGDIWSNRYFHVATRFTEKRFFLGTTDPATTPVLGEMGAQDDSNVWQPAFFKANHKIVLNSGDTGRSSGKVIIGATQAEAVTAVGGAANYALYKLIVNGSSVAQNFISSSSREYKTDIQPLTETQYRGTLDDLSKTEVFRFRYKSESPSERRIHTGTIAENSPEEILSSGKKGINTSSAIGFLIATVKELALQNEQLEKEVVRLEKELGKIKKDEKTDEHLAK